MSTSSIADVKPRISTILHIIPTLEGGGAERQLSLLAAEQAARGYDVHVAVRRTGVHKQTLKDRGVKIHELGDIRSIDLRLLRAIWRSVSEIKPDIVQTWLPQMDILGGLCALASRVPWIISERTSAAFFKEIPVAARLRLLLGQFASAVVANSDGGQKYWREGVYRSPKLASIRNAFDFDRIQGAVAPGKADCPPRPLLLVVGRFSREKALEIVVRALGDVSRRAAINVLVIGEGGERPMLEKEIELAALSEHVKIMPYQPDWWQWLKVADGLISMSRYEGNPNVVLEAMAGRCPVILSDIPAHREIADALSALFVPVDDVQALSAATATLIGDQDAARRRAEQAYGRVKSMTVTAMTDAYDTIYRQVAGGMH